MSFFRERTLLAKIEGVEGTDPTPTGAANAIFCSDYTVVPIGGGQVERATAFPTFGSMPSILVNKQVLINGIKVEGAGAGAAGTAPAYGPLLRACGLSETITAGVKVEYAPVSASQESITGYADESGALHKLTGARGNVSWLFPKDDIAQLQFDLCGRWNAPSAVALPSLTLTGFIDPLAINKVNTPTFTMDGFAAVLESLTVNLGNKVVPRDRPNAATVRLTDRMATGSVTFEDPGIGTKDFFALVYGQTQFVMQLIHGTVAGNIIQLDMPKVQMLSPSYVNIDGVRHIQAQLKFNRNAGDDELKFTVK
jgi:hypothetical protein